MISDMDKTRSILHEEIKLWNESRFDLFAISETNKNNECFGVIRFYHQDSANNAKYATKCVRVSSSAITSDVINTLAEKFRSDMRMLTKPKYALYEVHMDGEFRKLEKSEQPLLVQLNWIKDDREGRFLLRNDDDARPMTVGKALYEESEDTVKGFKLARNLTKKEKKVQKKKEKGLNKNNKEEIKATPQVVISAAKQLYHQVPESTFTRTVSNPEAVMKKRREQKLQKRGAKVLKVYGDTLNPEIPYKSLLLLPSDKTSTVIRDAIDKYGLGNENTSDFSLYQIVLPPGSKPEECFEGGWGKESILGPDECPLLIDEQWQSFQGTMIFKIRRNKHGAKLDNKKLEKSEATSKVSHKVHPPEDSSEHEIPQVQKATVSEGNLPSMVELTRNGIRVHSIYPNVTEIGANQASRTYGNFIQLFSDKGLQDSHCVLTSMDGIVTITPQDRVGNVMVNGEVIDETTMLYHGSVIKLGNKKALFCENGKPFTKLEILRKLGSSLTISSDNISKFDKHNSVSNNPFPNSPKQRIQSQSEVTTPVSKYKFPTTSNFNKDDVGNINTKSYSENLPISIAVNKNAENAFLSEILHLHGHNLHFKLSPSYSIYLTLRWFTKQLSNRTSWFIELVSQQTNSLIQTKFASVAELAFWMANISEILNFLRQDKDLCYLSSEVQDKFAKTVQLGFRHLVQCMQKTLFSLMPAFLSQSDADLPGDGDKIDLKKQQQSTDLPTMYDILRMLSSAMSLLRKCRVNAALTIQLFSQLFHSINMWLFNKLVTSGDGNGEILCTRQWGIRIRARLALIEAWAEKQGLELAADCHLARITQATYLLQAPKHTADDIAAISGTCFKLNSLQLHALLTNYVHDNNEQMIPPDMIDQVVSVAESSADELMRSDGRSVQLMEDPDLQLPFLLPEDGYSCDVVHGVPSGLIEFLQIFEQRGLCVYEIEPHSSGSWAVHFASPSKFELHHTYTPQPEVVSKPEVVTVEINKQGGGMGLSIVAARGGDTGKLGIYIRSVVKDSAADKDGRLQAGDQLLSVDGFSLVGIDQERAANLMTKTGQTVILQIAKQGAIYQGLAMILNQPYISSPTNDVKQTQSRQSFTPPPPTVLQPPTSPPSKYTKTPEKSSSTSQLNQQVFQVEQSSSLNLTAHSVDPTISKVPFEDHYPQSIDQDQFITSFDNPNYDKVDHLIQNMPSQNIAVSLRHKLPEEEKNSSPTLKLVESSAVSTQDTSKPSSYNFHSANKPFSKQTNKKKEASKKSSTLPRHFKSNSGLHRELRGNQEQTIQDELNALRDEEINELMNRKEKLSNMERDRLNTLQNEREFQNRIQEEKQKLFSDDEIPVEDFSSIPDRPDRDRLMKDQDDQELSGKHKIPLKADDMQLPTDRKNRRKDYFDSHSSESGKALYSHSKNKKLNVKIEKEEVHGLDKKQSIEKNTRFYPEYKKHEPIALKQPTSVASKQQQQEKDNINQIRQRIKRETYSRPQRPVSEGFALADKMRKVPHSYHMEQSFGQKGSTQSVLRSDPSSMTFKDRQRLFSREGASPVTKSRSSKTLLEIERNLKNQI